MWPVIAELSQRLRVDRGHGSPAEIHQRQHQDGEHGHLDFLGLDFLADIFRRPADHEPGDEDRDDDEQQHAVHAGADAADNDLAELDVDQRDHATERGERVVHGVDGAARSRRSDHREQRRGDDAEADFLAFHIAAGKAERIERGRAIGLGPVADDHAGDEQHAHHGEDGPALALVADHAAEHVGERGAECEDQDDLQEVRKRGRVFKRMRSVGVEETAAIGAEHLDGDLRSDRTDRDGLLGAFQRGGVDIGAERLRHALPDQKQRGDDANWHENVERAAGDIDPEVADRLHRRAGEAADQHERQYDAGRRRQEVLVREAEHLGEVGQRAFTAVVLPIGVGDEAHRRIERQIGRHGRLVGRIERQQRLNTHQHIENEKPADME